MEKPIVLYTDHYTNRVICHSFAQGSDSLMCHVDNFTEFNKTIATYGYLRGTGEVIKKSKNFYYMDHGYFNQSSRIFEKYDPISAADRPPTANLKISFTVSASGSTITNSRLFPTSAHSYPYGARPEAFILVFLTLALLDLANLKLIFIFSKIATASNILFINTEAGSSE